MNREDWHDPVKVTDFLQKSGQLASGETVQTSVVTPWSSHGGFTQDLNKLVISISGRPTASTTLVMKCAQLDENSAVLAREGIVLRDAFCRESSGGDSNNRLKNVLRKWVPTVWYADGSIEERKKLLVMELVAGAHAGHFLDSPDTIVGDDTTVDVSLLKSSVAPEEVVLKAVGCAAELHAEFWNDREWFSQRPYLNGSGWYGPAEPTDQQRAAWETSLGRPRRCWESWRDRLGDDGNIEMFEAAPPRMEEEEEEEDNRARAKPHANPIGTLRLGRELSGIFRASWQQCNWEKFRADIVQLRPHVTFCHGDMHSRNLIVSFSSSTQPAAVAKATTSTSSSLRLSLVDWESAGIGSGPEDLGYMFLSVLTDLRRSVEKRGLDAYSAQVWSAFEKRGATSPFVNQAEFRAYVQQEYVQGGVGRFVRLLSMFIAMPGMFPLPFTQDLIDKLRAFTEDHGVTAASAPMPRTW